MGAAAQGEVGEEEEVADHHLQAWEVVEEEGQRTWKGEGEGEQVGRNRCWQRAGEGMEGHHSQGEVGGPQSQRVEEGEEVQGEERG